MLPFHDRPAVFRRDTTTIFCDSYEIANVCEVAGVEWMLEGAHQAPLNIFLTIDWVQRKARQLGLAPALAWSFGTLHPATRFALDSEIGSLGLGRRADLALTDD